MSESLQPLVFLGVGAIPEIIDIVCDINAVRPTYEMAAALDDNEALHGTKVDGVPVLGKLEKAHQFPDAKFVMAIGSYRTRLIRHQIIKRLGLPRDRYVTLVHPQSQVARSAAVGQGCILHAGVVIGCHSIVEDFVVFQPHCLLGASSHVGEGALFAAAVNTTAYVTIGHYCHVGLGTMIGEYAKIGPGAQVAMASVVLRDVPPGVFLFQNRCLDRQEVPAELLARWAELLPTRPQRKKG